ncbi:MAG: SGNH/GDSL hydrolase family protein [Burkholderiales bacterium]
MRQIYEYHPKIGFRFVPRIRARVPHEGGGYLLRTNDYGFRSDSAFARERSGTARRVLLFGDSFTAGEGVSNGQRFGDLLEKIVPDLEVYNFGLPATGPDQHYLVYQEYAREIEHDLLVIAVFVENIRRVASRYRYFVDDKGRRVLYGKPYFELKDGELSLRGVPPPKLPVDPDSLSGEDRRHIFTFERFPALKRQFNRLKRYGAFRDLVIESGLKDNALSLLGYQPIKEYDNPQDPAWLVMRALLTMWIRNHPRPVMLMPIPLHHYAYGVSSPRAYQERLSTATDAAGGNFFDPLPAFLARPLRERRTFYFPNDGHLTRAGHEALANAMAPAVAGMLEEHAGA